MSILEDYQSHLSKFKIKWGIHLRERMITLKFLETKITSETMYSLLPDYINLVLGKTRIPRQEFLERLLAVCAVDDEIGADGLISSVNRFYGKPIDDVWQKILKNLGVSQEAESDESCLSKMQKERIIVDVMLICLKQKGYEIACSLNSKAGKEVSELLEISDIAFTPEDKDENSVVKSLNSIRNIFYCDEDTLKLLSKYNFVLTQIYKPERISEYSGVCNFDEWQKSVKKIQFYSGDIDNLSNIEKDFVSTYFSVEDSISARQIYSDSIEDYKRYWIQSLFQLTFQVAEAAYAESPSITNSKLETLHRLYPVNISVGYFEDNLLSDKLMKIFVNNSNVNNDDIVKILEIISVLINKNSLNVAEIRSIIERR